MRTNAGGHTMRQAEAFGKFVLISSYENIPHHMYMHAWWAYRGSANALSIDGFLNPVFTNYF